MRTFTLLTALVGFIGLNAQTVVRGPYLQTPTDESIIVMWRTSDNTATGLWYGSHPDSLQPYVQLQNSVRDHSVTITGLAPYTAYYYAVGNTNGPLTVAGEQYRFRTHPLPGTEQPIRVWAIGDFGKGNAGQIAVKESYLAHPGGSDTDVWIWLGDNAYDDGKDSEYQSKVFGLSGFSDVFNWLPFYPSPGNHDYVEVWRQSTLFGIPYSNIPLQNHQGPYFDIVDVPEEAEAGGYPSQLEVYYSFDHGNTHFLSLNSEVWDFLNTSNGIDQMKAWIQQDLDQNDKPWVIAYFHQPPYSKGSHDSDAGLELVMKAMRERVVPLLEEYDVDLVVCGHSHVYERSHLIHGHYGNSGSFNPATMLKDGNGGNFDAGNAYLKDNEPTTPDGTVYVVCGNSGSGNSSGSMDHPIMVSNFNGSGVYGSFYMDIYRNRLDGHYLLSDGSIGDSFTILKQNMVLQSLTDSTICEGAAVQFAAARSGGSDEVTYLWMPGGNSGAEAELAPDETTTYTLVATDQLTGQVDSTSFTITVLEVPAPTITYSGDSLIATAAGSYQWYLNGEPVAGATQAFVESPAPGTWTVLLGNGVCSALSEPFFLGTTGLESTAASTFRVFPNPTESTITVLLEVPASGQVLRLFDHGGRQVRQLIVDGQRLTIDLSHMAQGSYLLVLEHGDGSSSSMPVVKE
jgi:hypothetical protein